MPKKIFMVSLGCPKNLVDSELMLGSLTKSGYEVCESPEDAELIVVNTCGFIKSAVEEAIDEILALSGLKETHSSLTLVVTGCLVQRYGDELKEALPEVDLFIGTDGFVDLPIRLLELEKGPQGKIDLAKTPSFLMDSSRNRQVSTPSHRAYLKISEGCSNNCSYCLIPTLRGRQRSRSLDDLIVEAGELEELGVKELTLVGQDVTAYGVDFGKKGSCLTDLLEGLLRNTSIPWLRMLYLYPNRISEALLELMATNPRLLPYFDIPLQHASDRILSSMNRPYRQKDIVDLLNRIRAVIPKAAIRSTFIVGFPGEKEEDVVQLENFLAEYRLDHVGVFAYSNEDGCAAVALPNHCSEEIKEERRQRIMALQKDISWQQNKNRIGRLEKVIVEGVSRETDLLLEGRTCYQAPEIDGCVYINSGTFNPGDIVELQITEAHPYDLVGEVVE